MATLVTPGDRQVLAGGSLSSLKRNSVPLSMFPGGSINVAGGGTMSYQQLYETQPWAHVVLNKLTRQVSRLPLKTYRLLAGTKTDGERERVRDHPLPALLKTPGPRRSPAWLKQKITLPTLMHGNGLLGKDYAGGRGSAPSGLVPLDWRYLTPLAFEDGELFGWRCAQPNRRGFYGLDEVVHFAWEGGRGDLGVAPLRALGVTFATEDSGQRYQASSFEHGLGRGGAFVIPADAKTTKEERLELVAHLKANAGVDKAFDPLLLFAGAKWEGGTHTAVEAELIDQRKLNREEVAAVYDIPPPLIGILDNATYSNIETQHQMLYTDVLGPWLTLIEETLQAQLIDSYAPWAEEGLFVEFDLAEVLKGDTLKEVQAIREAIATGIMTPNEGRQIRNLPPSDDPEADRLHMPVNNLSPMGSAVDSEVAKAIERHLKRAADRLRDKGDPGIDRFERELAHDTKDADLAADWAARVADAPDEAAIRSLATEL